MKTKTVENKTRDWELLFAESEYIVLSELIKLYKSGKIEELGIALQLYRDSIKQNDELELRYQLEELMQCIILWKVSPNYRTKEQAIKILNQRGEINLSLQFDGSVSTNTIKNLWNHAFENAKENAVIYEKSATSINILSWEDVFDYKY